MDFEDAPQDLRVNYSYMHWKIGNYAGLGMINSTTQPAVAGRMYFTPMLIPFDLTVDRIVSEVTSAGSSGSVVRMGIYNSDTDGYPSTLVVDGGTYDSTSTGDKEVTINQALSAGYYHIATVAQGTPATEPTFRTMNIMGPSFKQYPDNDISDVRSLTFRENGTTGALPATATPTEFIQEVPQIRLRRSA